jgi:hypothetical protein
MSRVVFGYQTVTGVPKCPCGDPGNYLSMTNDDLGDTLECWCGRTMRIKFDTEEERAAFIKNKGQ